MKRWAWVEVDLEALDHNVKILRRVAGGAEVWAVVKADGYGHGAVPAAKTALDAGAAGLCVALTEEGAELRNAGVDGPILLLSQQPPDHAAAIIEHGLTPTVYETNAVDTLATAAVAVGANVDVNLKIDTGMQRVGAQPASLGALVDRIDSNPSLRLAGIYTHLAVADSSIAEHRTFTDDQLRRLDEVIEELSLDDDVMIHAANSAAILNHPRSHRHLIRAGIAMYGVSPGSGVDHLITELRPVMSLYARVSFVKRVRAGTGISYGLRHTFPVDTTVVTVPIGYADGVPRRLGSVGGEVLIAGRRCPIVGVVTMDQLMVDGGGLVDAGHEIRVGDEVVLIGRSGSEEIRAEDWADALETIGYEIVCGISRRVERYHRRASS